jgi:acetolactate synthase-1/2/3 large subunit
VEKTADVLPAMERAMASGKLAVAHCIVDPEAITPSATLEGLRKSVLASALG